MNNKKTNSYVKENGFRELKELKPSTIKEEKASVTSETNIPEANDGYTKTEKNLSPSLFIIISGGEKKEKDYFKKLKNDSKTHFPRIDLKFFSKEGQGLEPEQMFKVAMEKKDEYYQTDESDKFYLVSDVDDFRLKLLNIIPKCKEQNFNLIISNYCFEVWLYYSCFESKPTDFVKPEKAEKCSKACKEYVHQKYKTGITPHRAFLHIEDAIINSEKNYTEDEYGIPTEFSTQMHLLAKEILPLIQKELPQYKEGLKNTNYTKK